MSGRLIVIEGIDGSGKSTQFDLLRKRLDVDGVMYRYMRFPRYSEDSSRLVKMYLGGEFGGDAGKINPYIASVFYAYDRAEAFKDELGDFYRDGGVLLLDRYTTANAVHQGAKLEGDARGEFSDWLFDFEYNRLGLPRPAAVILLDMPVEIARRLIGSRGGAADIHEKDGEFLRRSAESARYMAGKYGWARINCGTGGNPRSPEDIAAEVFLAAKKVI